MKNMTRDDFLGWVIFGCIVLCTTLGLFLKTHTLSL